MSELFLCFKNTCSHKSALLLKTEIARYIDTYSSYLGAIYNCPSVGCL